MYTYLKSEDALWTVGFYDPNGKWHSESDHSTPKEAADRVIILNGGNPSTPIEVLDKDDSEGFAPGVWYKYPDHKPPINKDDEWDNKHGISMRVLTCGECGLLFGKMVLSIDHWNIEGVSGSFPPPTHFMIIEKPKQ